MEATNKHMKTDKLTPNSTANELVWLSFLSSTYCSNLSTFIGPVSDARDDDVAGSGVGIGIGVSVRFSTSVLSIISSSGNTDVIPTPRCCTKKQTLTYSLSFGLSKYINGVIFSLLVYVGQ